MPGQTHPAKALPDTIGHTFWLSAPLAAMILALGLYAAWTTALTVYRTHSPIIYWDQWEVVGNMMGTGGKLTLPVLWAQHNEHRIPVGRIACFADLNFFGGRNTSLLIEIYLVQVCAAVLLIWMFRRFGKFSGPVFWTAAGFSIFCMLSPIQMENFIWGFQIAFVFAGFAATFSFASLILHATKTEASAKRWFSWPLLVSYCAAFLAECSLASGLLAWPILVLLGFNLRLPKRTQILTAAVGSVAVGAYSWGYYTPPQHAKPWETIQHPIAMERYVLKYFVTSWNAPLPPHYMWPEISLWITRLAIALALGGVLWLLVLRRPGPGVPLRTFLAANLLFTFLAAVVTSLGRLNFGIGQATSGRYQVTALLFWASLAALILTYVAERRSRWLTLAAAQIALLVLMLVSARSFPRFERGAEEHQAKLARGYAALEYAPQDDAAIRELYPQPERVRELYAYMRSHHLGPDPAEFAAERALLPGQARAK